MKVVITGKEVQPCLKLLNALTRAFLLHPDRITWEEATNGEMLTLNVPDEETIKKAFDRYRTVPTNKKENTNV